MKEIILKKNHEKYFLFQRNEYLSDKQLRIRKLFGRYLFTKIFINFFNSLETINLNLNIDFKKEFKGISKYLPKKVSNILDIGSGIGVIDVFLSQYYKGNVNFTLIDKNFTENKVYYGFNDKGQAYNDFKVTKDFLLTNGLKSNQISIFDADSSYSTNIKYDLVISLLSMGYHYPVKQYFSFFKTNTHKDTVFIFDIAEEYNDKDNIFSLFDTVEVIYKSNLPRHNYYRIYCIGFKS